MFAKLLKHEWRATRGIVGLLCAIILVSGIMIGGVMNYMIGWEIDNGDMIVVNESEAVAMDVEPMSDFAVIMCVLLLSAGIIAVAVCCAASLFFVIYRFYKRCFTDEGYLTFTLPATNHQILLSSITNCIVSEVVTLLAACAAVLVAVVIFLLAFPENLIWADVWVSCENAWQQIVESFWKNAEQFALVGFSGVVGAISELILLMTAVTIGALIAKKHKLLASVGVYYGISMVQSFVYSAFAVSAAGTQAVNTVLAMPGVMGIVLIAAGYFTMHYLTSKKLNLA